MECAMDVNGLILNSYFVPPEILAHILHYVEPDDLIYSCRFVCKNWNQIIIDEDVWKLKISASNLRSLSKLKLPWHNFYHICSKNPFEKNLLLNNCGQNELLHWYLPPRNNNETKSFFVVNEVSSQRHPRYAGNELSWNRYYRTDVYNGNCVIESYPIGADPLPECDDFGGHKSCFVTSHTTCVKEQTIDLLKNGIPGFILDTMQPKIIASEWFTGRYDCGFEYKLTVSLISSDGETVIQRKEAERISRVSLAVPWEKVNIRVPLMSCFRWKTIGTSRNDVRLLVGRKVSLEFKNYGPGVRFVTFNHRGKDTRCWAGYYGTKMAGGVVKVTLSNLTGSIAEP